MLNIWGSANTHKSAARRSSYSGRADVTANKNTIKSTIVLGAASREWKWLNWGKSLLDRARSGEWKEFRRLRAAAGKGVKGIHRLRDPERARAVGLFCQLGLEIQSKLPHD